LRIIAGWQHGLTRESPARWKRCPIPVIRFRYLWAREAERGETEGRKLRPVAVGVRISRPKGEDVLVLFPITSQPPAQDRFAVEIPEVETRRAGLGATVRLFMILDEYNQDIIGQSFYLEPEPPLGRFSKAFFLPLMKEFVARRSRAQREPSTLNWVTPSRDLIFLFNSQNTAALIQQRLGKERHR
jgi:hypothetical protein